MQEDSVPVCIQSPALLVQYRTHSEKCVGRQPHQVNVMRMSASGGGGSLYYSQSFTFPHSSPTFPHTNHPDTSFRPTLPQSSTTLKTWILAVSGKRENAGSNMQRGEMGERTIIWGRKQLQNHPLHIASSRTLHTLSIPLLQTAGHVIK